MAQASHRSPIAADQISSSKKASYGNCRLPTPFMDDMAVHDDDAMR